MFSEQVHHVAIICSNYKLSKKFYSQVLGFEVVQEVFRPEKKSWKLDLRINPQTHIELFSFPESPPRPSWPEACGLRHLAFKVESVEHAKKYLESLKVDVEEIRVDEQTGRRFTFFQDPDGLPLEIYE